MTWQFDKAELDHTMNAFDKIPDDGQAGFSLVELLIVLAILALATSLTVARLPGHGSGRLEARRTTQEIVSLIRATRLDAQRRGSPSLLKFSETERSFSTPWGAKVSLPVSQKVSVLSSGQIGVDGIAFYPDGHSSGGQIRILEGHAETIIDIDWLTGRYRRQEVAS